MLNLVYNRIMTSARYNASLMVCERAEIAGAEAAAVMNYGEFYLFYSRNAAERLIRRMIVSHKRQRINLVHLLGCKWGHRRILYQYHIAVTLNNGYSSYGVVLLLLNSAGNRILPFPLRAVFPYCLKGRTLLDMLRLIFGGFNRIAGSENIGHSGYFFSCRETVGNFDYMLFAHTVHKQIGSAFNKN